MCVRFNNGKIPPKSVAFIFSLTYILIIQLGWKFKMSKILNPKSTQFSLFETK